MSKYVLIDLTKLEAGNPVLSATVPAAAVLSVEETEAKFKEVWNGGYTRGAMVVAHIIDKDNAKVTSPNWEEFKKTL